MVSSLLAEPLRQPSTGSGNGSVDMLQTPWQKPAPVPCDLLACAGSRASMRLGPSRPQAGMYSLGHPTPELALLDPHNFCGEEKETSTKYHHRRKMCRVCIGRFSFKLKYTSYSERQCCNTLAGGHRSR